MECFENGLITTETTDGLELRFGNADAMVEMTKRIVNRDGFGDILAEGSEAAANILGLGHEYLLTSKGMEAPAHMPQLKRSLAVIYATNPFGSDHQSHEHDPFYEGEDFQAFKARLSELGLSQGAKPLDLGPEKIRYTCMTQQYFSFLDSACLCQFAWGPAWELYGAEDASKLFKAVTGWDVSVAEQLEVGERRLNMMRAFNAREGVGRERDTLPAKFFDKPLALGPSKGLCLDRQEFEDALNEYYRQSGWDTATGNPLAETYNRLGLDWVADMLGLTSSSPASDAESNLQPA
jgi:aldehyde:ferredoxin oxidoreductase